MNVQWKKNGRQLFVVDPLNEDSTSFDVSCNGSEHEMLFKVGLFIPKSSVKVETWQAQCVNITKGITVTYNGQKASGSGQEFPANVSISPACGELPLGMAPPENTEAEVSVAASRRLDESLLDVVLVANFSKYVHDGTHHCVHPATYHVTSATPLWAVDMEHEITGLEENLKQIIGAMAGGWILSCLGCLFCACSACVCFCSERPRAREFRSEMAYQA
jgi:hypothetical protein